MAVSGIIQFADCIDYYQISSGKDTIIGSPVIYLKTLMATSGHISAQSAHPEHFS
jgi:hypothetical protein